MRNHTLRILTAAILASIIVVPLVGAEKKPPLAKIEIMNPQSGARVSGSVEVKLKVTKDGKEYVPSIVFAGIGGPPWVQLQKTKDKNEWKVKIDSTLVPNKGQVLQIITDNKKVRASRKVTVENPLKVYFADLHSHTQYSDGSLLPSVAHDYARKTARLDVFSLTDHLESVDDTEWADTRHVAERATEEGRFIAIPGLEWTKKIGHTCIYDPQTRHWPEELGAFYKAAADAGVTVKFNHPGDGSKVFNGMAYSKVGDKAVQLTEVRRLPEEQAFIRALNNGWHIAPEGSDDTHSPNWGKVKYWTGLLMPGLSRRNVLHALENRRCYSTLDRNCQLYFTLNGYPMGEIVGLRKNEIELDLTVIDPDYNDKIAKVELYENGEVVRSKGASINSHQWTITFPAKPHAKYYFVKVTQADGNTLWSAPIWVKDMK